MRNLLIAVTLTLLSTFTYAIDYEMDFNYNKVDHGWRATGTDRADWKLDTHGVGVTAWFNENWGARLFRTTGGTAKTDGRYSDYRLDYKDTTGFEVKYRQELFSGFTVFVGVGIYDQPLPIYSPNDTLIKDDSDDDEGYLYGFSYKFTKNWGATYQHTQQSRITDKSKNLDEWIITQSFQIFYRF